MKRWLADELICPDCLEKDLPLTLRIREAQEDEVWAGELTCPGCGAAYPIREGVAILLPEHSRGILDTPQGYNAPAMLSAYLWSHFGDLIKDPLATTAYTLWASQLLPAQGSALDVGCGVGRLTFELSRTHPKAVGMDTSFAFIQAARKLLRTKQLEFELVLEGHVMEPRTGRLPEAWDLARVEFILADALALPFRKDTVSTLAAVNILEKVPDPKQHLAEVNRVLKQRGGRFLFSDPFSWDEAFSPPEAWLGGNPKGPCPLRGIETLRRMFAGEYGVFSPPLSIEGEGEAAWKIRKTAHLWEHITSQYLVGYRP